MTAIAMDNNINVVAALDIHMLNMADVNMKPKTNRRPLEAPHRETILNAILRWAPLRSIPTDNMNPPSIRRIIGLP